MGYAQLLQYGKKTTEEYKNISNAILDSCKYLLSLIDDLLDISKIENSSFELFPDIIDFKAFINSILSIIQVLAHKKNIHFKTEIDKDLPHEIIADDKRLHQVLINLLGNAVKFTEQGEIYFCVKKVQYNDDQLDKKTISVGFEIKDTGPGIKQDRLKEIFIPYKQVANKIKNLEGFGLGLSISQRIIQLMGSKICVESTPGKGSRFLFQIEVPFANEILTKPKEVKGKSVFNTENPPIVMIVDDVLTNRFILREFLNILGCNILLAENGHECLQKVKKTKPDIILMDIQMPGIDGFQTMKLIRKINEIKHTPIIAVSASTISMTKQSIIEKGFNDYVSKPVVMEELATILKKFLNYDAQHIGNKNIVISQIKQKNYQVNNQEVSMLPILDKQKAMSYLKNDQLLLKEILEMTLKEIPLYLDALKKYISNKHNDKIKFQIHKFKTCFKLIGAARCQAFLDIISQKNKTSENDPEDLHLFEIECNKLIKQAKIMIQEIENR